tara:strand:+ start:4175 stop:4852 length:678 start_codon:yes stop_codon:yes gene_type:complete
MDIEDVSKIIDSKLMEKVYEDAASPATKQLGHFGEDTVKALRLFTAPIQLLATGQDRFERWLNDIRVSVPIEKQCEAKAEIAGPILMNLRFMDESSPLHKAYLNLLKSAINSDTRDYIHPGYVKTIEQISPHDARLLELLNRAGGFQVNTGEKHNATSSVLKSLIDELGSWSNYNIELGLEILESLNLIRVSVTKYTNDDNNERFCVMLSITYYGNGFLNTCLPE